MKRKLCVWEISTDLQSTTIVEESQSPRTPQPLLVSLPHHTPQQINTFTDSTVIVLTEFLLHWPSCLLKKIRAHRRPQYHYSSTDILKAALFPFISIFLSLWWVIWGRRRWGRSWDRRREEGDRSWDGRMRGLRPLGYIWQMGV